MTKQILFFDLATSTGWATHGPSGLFYGSFQIVPTGNEVGRYLNVAEDCVRGLALKHRPDMMAFSSVLLKRRDTPIKLRKLYGLSNVVEQVAHRLEIECKEDLEDRIRRHFLGRNYPRQRNLVKTATMVTCRKRGWDPANDDEGDALAGLDYFRSLYDPGFALAATPLFQNAR